MKAVVFDKLGGPEMLKIAEVPKPEVKPGTVLIKVRAAGINFADTLFRQGKYAWQPTLPDTPRNVLSGRSCRWRSGRPEPLGARGRGVRRFQFHRHAKLIAKDGIPSKCRSSRDKKRSTDAVAATRERIVRLANERNFPNRVRHYAPAATFLLRILLVRYRRGWGWTIRGAP